MAFQQPSSGTQRPNHLSNEERHLLQHRGKSKGSISDDEDETARGGSTSPAPQGRTASGLSNEGSPLEQRAHQMSPGIAPGSMSPSQSCLPADAVVHKRTVDLSLQLQQLSATSATAAPLSPAGSTHITNNGSTSSPVSSAALIVHRSPLVTIPHLSYTVLKKHHRMTWLKQYRTLVITPTEIWNCKLKQHSNDTPLITKSHTIKSIAIVAVKSKTSLMLRFAGDHDYFYSSSKVLEILWEIKKRMWAAKAADKLTQSQRGEQLLEQQALSNNSSIGSMMMSPEAQEQYRKEKIMKLFLTDQLFLPFCDDKTEQTMEFKLDIVRALQAKALDHSERIQHMVNEYTPPQHVGLVNLALFREQFEELREMYAFQLVTRERSLSATLSGKLKRRELPSFEDLTSASNAVEEALQTLIHAPLFDKLWYTISCNEDIQAQERAFRSSCKNMCQGGPSAFDLRADFANIKYDLTLHQLIQVGQSKTPLDMMDGIVEVAKSILVTVEAHAIEDSEEQQLKEEERRKNKGGEDKGEQSRAATRSSSMSADDMLPLLIFVLAHSTVKGIVLVREFIIQLGDMQDVSERTYYFTMFCSAIEFIQSWTAAEGSPASPAPAISTAAPEEEPAGPRGAVKAKSEASATAKEGTGGDDSESDDLGETAPPHHDDEQQERFQEVPDIANLPSSFGSESSAYTHAQHPHHHFHAHNQQHSAPIRARDGRTIVNMMRPKHLDEEGNHEARSTSTTPVQPANEQEPTTKNTD